MQMILFLIYINFEIYNDLSDDPSGFFLDYTIAAKILWSSM
jgi:hypothetical protein